MTIHAIEIKPILPVHMVDARLFSDRYELMKHIKVRQDMAGLVAPNILEIGVALGDFSQFLIETFHPGTFAAVDLFDLHLSETIWGMPTTQLFNNKTQIAFYKSKISGNYNGNLIIEEGLSAEATARLDDGFYDIVYIDAGHDYENVRKDALSSLPKLRPGGYVIFNDYTMMDHLSGMPYGVVQAANELINDSGRMTVVGLGLDPQMFCDLAVQVR